MKAMFVAKDMGSSNVTLPIAKICRDCGDEVVVIGEGLASARFELAGFPLYFKGTVNWKVEPFTLDAKAVLQNVKPDVVVCGEGSPNHLEGEFALAANAESVPVVAVNDFWNGQTRLHGARLDLVLALDEFDAELIRSNQPNAEVVVVGNPGVPTADSLLLLACLPEVVELRGRFDKVLVYVGGDKDTTGEEIDFLIQCLHVTPGNWVIIPRFHPKHRELISSDGRTFGEVWKEQFKVLGDRVVYLASIGKTDPIAVSSDIVLSSFSTLLTTASAAGKVAGSLWVPSARESLKRQAGLDIVPVVALGCAVSMTEIMDLHKLQPASLLARAKLRPFDAEAGHKAIREFEFGRRANR